MFTTRLLIFFLFALGTGAVAAAAETVTDLQQAWARATYRMDPEEKRTALENLSEEAAELTAAHPDDAELLIWQGIILSSYAGEASGFTALGAAKRARKALNQALKLDPRALNGSAYTSLGALYFKVPGWPIGFGDDRKARDYLRQALEINPDGIDPNYFMGEFLLESGETAAAIAHLEKALEAPDRPGREVADTGRRQEIRTLLKQVQGANQESAR